MRIKLTEKEIMNAVEHYLFVKQGLAPIKDENSYYRYNANRDYGLREIYVELDVEAVKR